MRYISSSVCARKNKSNLRALDAPLSAGIDLRFYSSFTFFSSSVSSRDQSERGPPFPARNATELMSAPVCDVVTYVTHVAAALGGLTRARALVKECSTGVPPTPHALPCSRYVHVCMYTARQ